MFQILKTLSDTLSGKASIFIILTAIVTFFYPDLFAWVKGNTQTIILGIIMLTMGLTLTPNDFRLLAKRPLDIFIGAVAQFTIMPLVAFTLSWLFSQVPAFAPYSTAMAIGIILVGCCPGGVSSNIMSFLCKGDVAYSVGMTCASTLLAPVPPSLLQSSLRCWCYGWQVLKWMWMPSACSNRFSSSPSSPLQSDSD